PGGTDVFPGGCDYMRPINDELPIPLDERALDECVGLGPALSFGPVDWNGDNVFTGATNCAFLLNGAVHPNAHSVIADVNNDGVCIDPGDNKLLDTDTTGGDDDVDGLQIKDGKNRICQTAVKDGSDDLQRAAVGNTPTQPNVLFSSNDWRNLDFTSV